MLHKDLQHIFPGTPKRAQNITLTYKKTINDKLIAKSLTHIAKAVSEFSQLQLHGAVVGVSGGVDSAVALALVTHALPRESVTGVIVDLKMKGDETRLAIKIAKKFGIKYHLIDASKLFKAHLTAFPSTSTLAKTHLRSRLINTIVFQIADSLGAVMIDTTNKSEETLTLYEESFKGHVAPLISLYKSEVYDLADHFGLSELRKKRSGCPNLLDIDAFGVDWEILDPILCLLLEKNHTIEKIGRKHGVDIAWLRNLERRLQKQPLRTRTKKITFGT